MSAAKPYGQAVTWEPAKPRIRPLRLVLSWLVAAASLWLTAAVLPGGTIGGAGGPAPGGTRGPGGHDGRGGCRARGSTRDRGDQRGPAACARRAATAVHGRNRLRARAVRERVRFTAREQCRPARASCRRVR